MSAVSCALSASTSAAALAWSFVNFVCAAATRAACVVASIDCVCWAEARLFWADVTATFALVNDACCCAAVAPVGCTASASLVRAEARFILATLKLSCVGLVLDFGQDLPGLDLLADADTSISLTMPLFWKSRASCVDGLDVAGRAHAREHDAPLHRRRRRRGLGRGGRADRHVGAHCHHRGGSDDRCGQQSSGTQHPSLLQ